MSVAGVASLTAPAPAAAQTVVVEVAATADGRPLAGALATLLDTEGGTVRAALTSPAGRAVLEPGAPGTYAVRVELIGHQATTSAAATVGAGETRTIRVTLATHAIPLAEIRVEAEGRCSLRPDEASTLGRVWEDARAALSVQAWTEAEGAYRLDLATWERDLDPQGRRVEREDRRRLARVGRVPFASLPAERLLADGFITRLDDGGLQYYGPDAALLLSDAFLDTHCLGLTRDPRRAGALGLTFAPERAGERPDIRGVLWLDERSGALQEIEYGYTSAPYPEAAGVAGGRIELDALPNGAWVIDRWAIRAPLLGRDPSAARGDESGIRVIGIRETGGELERVSTLAGDPIVQTAYGAVRGTVWDSTSSAPLAGARVHLTGTEYESETDAEGAFVIEGVPEGVFTASVEHPRLDSLGIAVPGVEADVPSGGVAEVALHVPSIEGALVQACGAVLTGRVLDAHRGEPVAGARVSVRWQVVEALEPAARTRDEGLDAWSDGDGRYTACGVAQGELLRVEAAFLGTGGAAR
ncbi:MAG: carboxypeptidase regulatory-like domain-containing protein, partial [Myxococcota bacterium]